MVRPDFLKTTGTASGVHWKGCPNFTSYKPINYTTMLEQNLKSRYVFKSHTATTVLQTTYPVVSYWWRFPSLKVSFQGLSWRSWGKNKVHLCEITCRS